MDNKNELVVSDILSNSGLTQKTLLTQANSLLDTMLDYKGLRLEYACAIREIRTKLEILDTEFEVRYQRNPISTIHTRLKSQTSVMEKWVARVLQ